MQDLREILINGYIEEILRENYSFYEQKINKFNLTLEERAIFIMIYSEPTPSLKKILDVSIEDIDYLVSVISSLYVKLKKNQDEQI